MLKSKPQTPSRAHRPPPLLLSHVKTSPTLRHPHPTLLPSPLSEWNSFPAIQASTWDEVEKREVRLERERVNGRRARGRSIVQDVEWGLLEEDFNQKRQRHESLATGTLVPPPHLETRRISLGFQETLTPVLPTVRSSPALSTLLAGSPAFSKFVRGSPKMKTSSSCSSLNDEGGSGSPRLPPSRYSFSSDPPSPQTNFSRPMSLGVPTLASPQSIGSSPMRTPVSSMKTRRVVRKRSALGESTYHNSTPKASSSAPTKDDLFSSASTIRFPKSSALDSAPSTITRSIRRRRTTTASTSSTPTPRNQSPLDLALLSSCISLSLSSPAVSYVGDGSNVQQPSSSSSFISNAVQSTSRGSRTRSFTTSLSLGTESLRSRSEERTIKTEVELGLEKVMRLAEEVMEETNE